MLVGGAEDERESADSQMEVLTARQIPLQRACQEVKLIPWGLCCVAGFCWRHVHLFFVGDMKRQ